MARGRGAIVSRKLTPKQERFVQEYLIDLNATQAAIRAGYSAKTAEQQGYQLLQKPSVQAAIAARQKEREQRTAVNQQITVEEYRLQVTLNMECIRTDLDKPLWKGAVSDYGSLPGTGDLAAREAALDEAVEKIVQEIITRTVAAW